MQEGNFSPLRAEQVVNKPRWWGKKLPVKHKPTEYWGFTRAGSDGYWGGKLLWKVGRGWGGIPRAALEMSQARLGWQEVELDGLKGFEIPWITQQFPA